MLRVSLCSLGLLTGCVRAPAAHVPAAPTSIVIDRPALYPETAVYVRGSDAFLVGSVRHGGVYRVDQAGRAQRLVDDPRLHSVLGIAVDEARDRLWVTNSDIGASTVPSAAGAKKLASVGVYELSSGRAVAYVDLAQLVPGPHLLNGIALDAVGNAYVTDSFSPAIYVIEGTRARVLVQDARFVGEGVNLNGVVVHPDGYLLVVKKSDGALFKVPLAHPAQLTRVNAEPVIAADGLLRAGSEQLVVVANRIPTAQADAALVLTSDDGWASARRSATAPLGDVYPTTITARGGRLYVLHSKLDRLLQAPPAQKATLTARAVLEDIGSIDAAGARLRVASRGNGTDQPPTITQAGEAFVAPEPPQRFRDRDAARSPRFLAAGTLSEDALPLQPLSP